MAASPRAASQRSATPRASSTRSRVKPSRLVAAATRRTTDSRPCWKTRQRTRRVRRAHLHQHVRALVLEEGVAQCHRARTRACRRGPAARLLARAAAGSTPKGRSSPSGKTHTAARGRAAAPARSAATPARRPRLRGRMLKAPMRRQEAVAPQVLLLHQAVRVPARGLPELVQDEAVPPVRVVQVDEPGSLARGQRAPHPQASEGGPELPAHVTIQQPPEWPSLGRANHGARTSFGHPATQ